MCGRRLGLRENPELDALQQETVPAFEISTAETFVNKKTSREGDAC